MIDAGKSFETPFIRCTEDDYPIFSYTSGTTGDSKGAKITHKNLMGSSMCLSKIITFTKEDAVLSYLPYPHVYEQMHVYNAVALQGSKVGYFSGNPANLLDDLAALKTTYFPSVPRVWNKIYSQISTKKSGCKELIGGKVTLCCSAAAPIDKQVIEHLSAAFECPFVEAYGLTECAGAATISWPEDKIFGHIGGPLSCVRLRLMDIPEMGYLHTDKPYPRGELCMKGLTVFSGYYKRPDKTAEAFDSEGWFKTGDVAIVYPNGSIKIIDRSKNIFKLA